MKERTSFLASFGMLLLFCLLLVLIFLPQPERKRVEADWKECFGNLHQIYQALSLYQEKFGNLPKAADTKGLEPLFQQGFDRDLRHFVCPGTVTQTRGELRDDTLSYYYFPPASGKLGGSEMILCDHPGNHPGGRIQILFGDGSVKWMQLKKPVLRKDLPETVQKGRLSGE